MDRNEIDSKISIIRRPLGRMFNGVYGDEAKEALKALAQLDNLLTSEPETTIDGGYWWCPECKEKVEPHAVTFQKDHVGCGARVVWKEPTSAEPEPCEDARFAKVARLIVARCLGSLEANSTYIEAVHTLLVQHFDPSHVADKRAEELRAQEVASLIPRWEDLMLTYNQAVSIPIGSFGDKIDRFRGWKVLRERLVSHLEETIVATEPKP